MTTPALLADDRAEIERRLRDSDSSAVSPALPSVLPALPAATGDLVQAFTVATRANQSDCVLIENMRELPAVVADFLLENKAPPQVLCEDSFLPLPWPAAALTVAAEAVRAPQPADSCGITGVTAAAANNGALLLADDVPRRLTLSLTPPYHVAVVPAAVIAPDLPSVWRRLPQPLPRGCVLAAGPSRTADIEQTLTLGAHGPVRVLVVVVKGSNG